MGQSKGRGEKVLTVQQRMAVMDHLSNKRILTAEQRMAIMQHPQYPHEWEGLHYDILSGHVEAQFGGTLYRVKEDGTMEALHDNASETMSKMELHVQDLERKLDNLTSMVQIMMSASQRLRCTQKQRAQK